MAGHEYQTSAYPCVAYKQLNEAVLPRASYRREGFQTLLQYQLLATG